MERSTRILRDLLPLSSSCFLEFRKCWWIEWIHELYSTTQMALWTSMNSSFFWGWVEWHILTPSTPGSCALWFASSSFVFPCSPQMRCNFQTAQLGTSFAALVPKRVPGLGYWSLFRVFFFRCGACPTLRSFSQLLSLSAPASASTSSASSAEPACRLLFYAILYQHNARNQRNFGCLKWFSNEDGHAHVQESESIESHRQSIKWTKPTNVGFHGISPTNIGQPSTFYNILHKFCMYLCYILQ